MLTPLSEGLFRRERRYGIRSVYFRTGVKDVLASFEPVTLHAEVLILGTDAGIADKHDGLHGLRGWGTALKGPYRRERAILPHFLYLTVMQIVTVSIGSRGGFPLSGGTGSFRADRDEHGECGKGFYGRSASVKS
jgi:hypothetical protein